jgi:translation initiation factor 1 (eIF-1/SUI1)
VEAIGTHYDEYEAILLYLIVTMRRGSKMGELETVQAEFFPEVIGKAELRVEEPETRGLPQVELSYAESSHIEKLLVDNYIPVEGVEDQVIEDIDKLKKITAEIKTISKQSIILQGERIQTAREILRKYGDGQNTFTQWVEKTYNNRRTAYNILSYYELYKGLPGESYRIKMKQMPLQAAYTLASREGDAGVKADLIQNYDGERQQDMIMLIQDRLPLSTSDRRKRKAANVRMLDEMEKLGSTLEKRKHSLSEDQRKRAHELLQNLHKLLEPSDTEDQVVRFQGDSAI